MRVEPLVEVVDAVDDAAADLGVTRSAASVSKAIEQGCGELAIPGRILDTEVPLLQVVGPFASS